jgi:predicted  nucleic acid-binding Zn-ribbon protein
LKLRRASLQRATHVVFTVPPCYPIPVTDDSHQLGRDIGAARHELRDVRRELEELRQETHGIHTDLDAMRNEIHILAIAVDTLSSRLAARG